ncbi:peroxiredoxin [Motilibacter peucedani]|uniref:Peroxiredoxin n=1 Tax=Motilibacter peucedani TaxID=598650 RepID=A0A420XP50_9ACTN|nr:peroxiredoxin [Motilibacter peucedani]RKS73968.1 peroxiredoxin [Motilibacter peucedani]
MRLGDPAPAFTLEDTHGTPVSLASLRGTRVLLVFFPHAFTPVCTGEVAELDGLREALAGHGVRVLGVSCDPAPALRAFAEQQGFGFDLLSDFWPHGAAARSYGVFGEARGIAGRGSFLVDEDGLLRWSVLSSGGEPRDAAGYLAAAAALG